jgi:hypothetical protein
MTLNLMVECCAAEGVTVSVDSGKLVIAGTPAVLDEWRPLLRSFKAELLALLAGDLVLVAQRAAHFLTQHVDSGAAHALALRLQTRDAQHDERRLCLECSHLFDTARAPRCAQWRQAGHGGPQMPRELPMLLQRCKAFRLERSAIALPQFEGDIHSLRRPVSARPAEQLEGITQ